MKKTTLAILVGIILVPVIASACGGNCGSSGSESKTEAKPPIVKSDDSAEQPNEKPQTTCPVMGGKINKKQFTVHDEKKIYVCCPGCIGTINADPDKYVQILEKQGVILDSAEEANKKEHGKHDGHSGHKD